jgi:hypothetical protein
MTEKENKPLDLSLFHMARDIVADARELEAGAQKELDRLGSVDLLSLDVDQRLKAIESFEAHKRALVYLRNASVRQAIHEEGERLGRAPSADETRAVIRKVDPAALSVRLVDAPPLLPPRQHHPRPSRQPQPERGEPQHRPSGHLADLWPQRPAGDFGHTRQRHLLDRTHPAGGAGACRPSRQYAAAHPRDHGAARVRAVVVEPGKLIFRGRGSERKQRMTEEGPRCVNCFISS